MESLALQPHAERLGRRHGARRPHDSRRFARRPDLPPTAAARSGVGHHAWPLVDASGAFVGLVTRGDLIAALERESDTEPTVLEIGARAPITAGPDEPLSDAFDRMIRAGVGRLPVIDPADPTRLVGMLGRAGLAAAYRTLHEEEHVRDARWPLASLHTSRTDPSPQHNPTP